MKAVSEPQHKCVDCRRIIGRKGKRCGVCAKSCRAKYLKKRYNEQRVTYAENI